VRPGRLTSYQLSPRRIIELSYFLDYGGFSHNLPKLPELFRLSFLAAPLKAVEAEQEDLYAATHILFYVTDFGRVRPSFLDEGASAQIIDFLVISMRRAIRAHHWDLVAELLFSLQCLGCRNAHEINIGWRALVRAQDNCGAILEGPEATAPWIFESEANRWGGGAPGLQHPGEFAEE
jgi:hypothetical protein